MSELKEKGIKAKNKFLGFTRKGARFMGHSLAVIFLALGTLGLVLAFVGVIFLAGIGNTGNALLAGEEWAMALSFIFALVLSFLAVFFFSLPEGYLTNIAALGTTGLLAALMIVSIVLGTVTIFASTTTLLFFSAAILMKWKFKIRTKFSSLIAGSTSIIVTALTILIITLGFVDFIGLAGKASWFIASSVVGLVGILLLTEDLSPTLQLFQAP